MSAPRLIDGDATAWPASAQRSRLAATETERCAIRSIFAHLIPGETMMSLRFCLSLPAARPRSRWPQLLAVFSHLTVAGTGAGEPGRAPLHRAMAREQRRANHLLHDADQFRPLSAAPISPSCITTAAWRCAPRATLPGRSAISPKRSSSIPDYARAYADRGSARLMQHDLDGAIADLDAAIGLDPNDAGAFMTRGNAFDEKADFDRAIADYNEAIRLSPNYAAAYFNRGLAFRRKGDFDHAIADYDQAIKLDPKNASALNNRGIVWFEKGDFDRAIADYNLALRADREFRAGLQQSRRRLARQERYGARARGFRSRHPAIAAIRAGLRQSRPGLLSEAGLSTTPSAILMPRSASIRERRRLRQPRQRP